jgi:2-polyprenyl-6-methoxyphenol hydroxylase-like FAD-dependent oxidoreductase
MSSSAPDAGPLSAIVVGGNFGGLAAAIALKRAGIDAKVYERAPDLAVLQGAKGAMHQYPNSAKACAVLGAHDRVIERGVRWLHWESWTAAGRMLGRWNLDELEQMMGEPTIMIDRRDLHQALLETLGELDPDAVRTGMRCVGFEQDEGGVTARFEGAEDVRADLLVGADGLKSTIRAQLHGPGELRPTSGVNIRGDATLGEPAMPVGTSRIYWGRGVQLGLNQVDDGRVAWFLRTVRAKGQADLETAAALVRGWAAPVEQVIAATEPQSFAGFELFDRAPLTSWGQGRVSLLGDAAHAMLNTLSQGAAMALEDAAVLQLTFEQRGAADVPGALRAYEQRRLPRTTNFVKRSRAMGNISLLNNPIGCSLRNVFISRGNNFVWSQTKKAAAESF